MSLKTGEKPHSSLLMCSRNLNIAFTFSRCRYLTRARSRAHAPWGGPLFLLPGE